MKLGSFVASITALSVIAMVSLACLSVTVLDSSSRGPAPQPSWLPPSMSSGQDAVKLPRVGDSTPPAAAGPRSRQEFVAHAAAATKPAATALAPSQAAAVAATVAATVADKEDRKHPKHLKRPKQAAHGAERRAADCRKAAEKWWAAVAKELSDHLWVIAERHHSPSQRTIASARVCARNFT